jgi:hypothetical protein
MITHGQHQREGEALAAVACRKIHTAVAVRDGRWSDPHTWRSGFVPGQILHGSDVEVLSDVEYDLAEPGWLSALVIRPHARLRHAVDRPTALHLEDLLVLEGGAYECGTRAKPIPQGAGAELGFRGSLWHEMVDPEQLLGGLLAWGDVTICGEEKAPFVRLLYEAGSADYGLTLAEPAAGWREGDRLAIPPSGGESMYRARRPVEFATLEQVDLSGRGVDLAAPLSGAHEGGYDAKGDVTFLPHVANLTRSVVVRSLHPEVRRAHMMAMGKCRPIIRYAHIMNMTRTRRGDAQIGRYAVHFHKLERV